MVRKNLEPRNILLIVPGNKIILSFWHFFFCFKKSQTSLTNDFSSVQFNHSVVSNSLQPHGLQHARPLTFSKRLFFPVFHNLTALKQEKSSQWSSQYFINLIKCPNSFSVNKKKISVCTSMDEDFVLKILNSHTNILVKNSQRAPYSKLNFCTKINI